jgi:cobyrinic acid a,c-diamide synthase
MTAIYLKQTCFTCPAATPNCLPKHWQTMKVCAKAFINIVSKGGLTYAECGGLMYLGKTLVNNKGESFPMAGVLNCHTSMENAKMTLGYRIMHWNDQEIRGHEFHYSKILAEKLQTEPATLTNAKGITVDTKLYRTQNTFASYTHLYWGDKPEFIEQLIKTAITESQSPSGDSRQPKTEV